MIPREHKWHIIVTCTLLLVAQTQAQGERTYDTGEWIPVTSTPSKSNVPVNQNQEQVASDRILNLEVPVQKFPVSKEYRPIKHEKINPNHVPRRLKNPSDYKFETPPPPPSRRVPQINYYAENSSPYTFEHPPIPSASQIVEQVKQNYLASTQQKPNAQALTKNYVPVPSINPEVPPVNAPSVYNQYQPALNSSYYQSLNPTTINDGLYQSINAINKVNEVIAQNSPSTTIQKTLPVLEKHTSSYEAPPQPNQNVQLVYVPVENLKPTQPPPVQQYQAQPQNINQLKSSQAVYSSKIPAREPQQFGFSNPVKSNSFNYINTPSPPVKSPVENKQKKLDNIEKDFVQQAYYAHKLQETLQDEINPLYQDGTTAKPRRKAHQPPLALFLESQSEAEVSDALNVLKDAKSIAVQDRLSPNSPSVFIGPSSLEVSEGYTKFPLPYLNNLNGNRIERKIDQLPFFVAPVSYSTPPGYSKIPLPSPHVGSVVVSIPRAPLTTTTRPTYFNPNPFGLNYNGYNFDYQTPSPVQNYVNPNYQTYDAETNSFQATPTTEQASVNGQNSFNVRQPPLYETQDALSNQPQRGVQENSTPLNTYKPIEESYSRVPQNNYNIPTTTPRQNEVKTNTENANSLDLAINNFELQQINNQFEQEHRKVKHSTTTRPQTISQYDFVSSTVQPLHTQNAQEYNTEAPSRGRVRDRNRGTAKVSTKPPLEEYKYTVLEEFLASMNKPTESYLLGGAFEDSSKLFGNEERTAVNPNQPLENAKDGEKTKPIQTGALETPQQVNQGNVNIENIPASVYNLGQQQQTYTLLDNTQNSQNLQGVLPVNYSPTGAAQDQRENSHLGTVQNNQAGISEQSTDSPAVQTKRRRLLRKKVQNTNNELETTAPGRQITSPGLEQAQIPTQQVFVQNINNENYNAAPVESSVPIENYKIPVDPNVATDQNIPIGSNVSPDLQERLKELAPNLFQPNFDQTYISLQDQAVRTLLTPNALPPATQEELVVTPLKDKQVISTTEAYTEIIPSVEPETEKSTTVRGRTRGRVRGRASTTTPASTVTSSSRRTAGRRRPTYTRTTTERVTSSSEYELKDDSVRTSTNTRQRTRTRGRQSQNQVTKKPAAVQTTEQQVKEQPVEQIYYANVNNEQIVQNVPQYTQSDFQQINTPVEANPEINAYNYIPVQSSTARNVLVEYENYNYNPTLSSNIPIQSIPTENAELPLVQEIVEVKPIQNEQVQQYNNANIRSAGILNNNPETTTAKTTPTRGRGRTRGRSRFTLSTTTTTTTSRPVTRPATTARPEAVVNEETEYYGFIRSPNYPQRNIEAQVTPSETIDQPAIQFVGEIRPKYTPTRTTAQADEELVSVETPRPRVRSRTRPPSSRTTNTYRQNDNDLGNSRTSEQSTRRPARTRGRGSAHYQGTENLKRGSKEEDVANQNYPVNFLQKFESTAAPQVTTPNFQITIGPNEDEDLLDQSAHSSFYQAKVLPAPNDISDAHGAKKASLNKEYTKSTEEKENDRNEEILDNTEKDDDVTESLVTTPSPEALPMLGTTKKYDTDFSEKEFEEVISDLESIQTYPTDESVVTTTSTPNSKRRGVWKLVRHEPVEPLEGSESQNYKTVLNGFETIAKVYPYTKNIYSAKKTFIPTTELSNIVSEENSSDSDDNNENNNEDIITTTEDDKNDEESLTTTTQATFKSQESIFDSIYEMFGLFNKENQNTTLTEQSTTISTTTLVNPTFPDEITEDSSTSVNINTDKYITKETEEDVSTPTTTTEVFTRKYDVHPWKMKVIKTSTSTEISHETEICYKGRCVKSKGRKMSK
ncbi:uncharacterized protein LOC115877660 [Sitophilus oryzae]|uniref:Uncharacterized protein LOC115877660 n=1 Tax=Sitophilus oryzae TaxID=7048 RepID=A0A6J2XEV6_SITOR|nr:uncharacterized protein LOC115877660 [Sitophilus oryzae]